MELLAIIACCHYYDVVLFILMVQCQRWLVTSRIIMFYRRNVRARRENEKYTGNYREKLLSYNYS